MKTNTKKTKTIKTKKFTLLSTQVTIHYVDKVEDEDGNWIFGKTRFCKNDAEIFISVKDENGKKIDQRNIDITLRHELFHYILDTLYFREQSGNESLIEWLAQATYQLNKQGLNI